MNLKDKILLLSYSKFLILKQVQDGLFLPTPKEYSLNEYEETIGKWIDCYKITCKVLGIEFNQKDLIPYVPSSQDLNTKSKFLLLIENGLNKDKTNAILERTIGVDAHIIYIFSHSVLIKNYIISAVISYLKKFPDSDIQNNPYLKEEYNLVLNLHTFIKDFLNFRSFKNKCFIIFDSFIYEKIEVIMHTELSEIQIDIKQLEGLQSILNEIVNHMFPQIHEISDNLKTAQSLITELNECRPGWNDWSKYEQVCIKILHFLFIPPFRKVYPQARTVDDYERRDAIIPNTHYEGFWKIVREEFNCRNIVFEFKNNEKIKDKSALNQLRIYLSKKTIGKFGMLFIRNEITKVCIKAQREAYEQEGILIFIVNDTKLEELIKAKAYLGSCNLILEDEKTLFEINY